MRNGKHKQLTIPKILAGAALAIVLGMPAAAQPAQSEPVNSPAQLDRDRRQPTVRTYDKFPDPTGTNQDRDVSTYDKEPDPSGKNQSLDFVRYNEVNEANNGENPVNLVIVEEGEE